MSPEWQAGARCKGKADGSLSIGDEGQAMAALESSGTGDEFRPNPEIAEGGKLTVWSGPPDAPFTYLGFKANEI